MLGSSLGLLRSAKLERAGFLHGFSTRLGGVSKPPFDSLDFAVLRDATELAENQRRFADALGCDASSLHQVMQVHGNALVVAKGSPSETLAQNADVIVGEPRSGHVVAVRIADCVPILLGDPTTGRVAAVHAGWRGIEAGVLGAAVEHLGPARASRGVMIAAIGPCIGPCCFEVGTDVAERIVTASSSDVVDRHHEGKVFIDLRRAVRFQLRALGIDDEAIDDVPGTGRSACTSCDRTRFYSYRRDKDDAGRLLAGIVAR